MTEDMSAMYRTAVSYVCLASVVFFVVVMVTIGTQQLNEMTGRTSTTIGVMEQSTLINISGLTVTGAAAYRIYSVYEGAVNDFEIITKDGHHYTQMSQLMNKDFIAKHFYVNSYQINDSGMWSVKLEER